LEGAWQMLDAWLGGVAAKNGAAVRSLDAQINVLRSQRLAELQREVSYIARLPQQSATGDRHVASLQGESERTQRLAGPGYGAWAAGPIRRRHEDQRVAARAQAPYAPPSRPSQMLPAHAPPRQALAGYGSSEFDRVRESGATAGLAIDRPRESDAAAGLLSLSPFNSPTLTASVDLLATPEIIGIAREGRPPPAAAELWQRKMRPGSPFVGLPPPLPSPTFTSSSARLTPNPSPVLTTVEALAEDCVPSGSLLSLTPSKSATDATANDRAGTADLPRRPSLTCMDMLTGL